MKKDAIPSQNLPKRSLEMNTSPKEKIAAARCDRLQKRKIKTTEVLTDSTDNLPEAQTSDSGTENDVTFVEPVEIISHEAETEILQENMEENNHSTIDDITSTPIVHSKATQTILTNKIDQFLSYNLLTDKEIKYFSGFNSQRFDCLYNFLTATNPKLPIATCPSKDQLLITLLKYKHNFDYATIGYLFRVPPRTIGNIFGFWTDHIHKNLKSVDFWSLGNKDPDKYRAIIDCTEIPVQKSENPIYHQLTYSNYKNRPTFKSLVAIDEAGKIIFCSELYGGSTSDRQIVTLSKFAELPEEGTTILADRGFEISDILEKRNVALNIPPFLRGKKQLSESEVMETRRIANRRIHVERLIGLSKINKILRDPMPSHLWPMASQINYNCIMLCNMKPTIVKSLPRKYQKKFWTSYINLCN